MHFLDSNIILRFLLADHPDFSPRARDYFNRLDRGLEQPVLLDVVLVEVTFVLTSKRTYSRSHHDVAMRLKQIVQMPALSIERRDIHLEALDLFGNTHLDYVDCLHVATARLAGPVEILSFDRDFDRFDGITRIEP